MANNILEKIIKKKIGKIEKLKQCTDLTHLNEIDKNITKVFSKNGYPDIFINASYPRTSEWKNATFKKLKLNSLTENVNIHMNSSAWIAIIIANLMKKKNKKGSIIFLNSIYGILGMSLIHI